MNKKKNYTSIESKIVLFDHCDVITTSSGAPELPIVRETPANINKQTNDVYNED